ncbi:MAG: nucleotidyl transferase AbiEii/AbiGii toxin family protein [Gammaproteobacteria bacterium]
MAIQFIEILKSTIFARANADVANAEILRNMVKEEIQYYVLNFIYHHSEYSKWTMYGGSALRICHNLNRMSVDLDFEIEHVCTQSLLSTIKKEAEIYFADKYGFNAKTIQIKTVGTRGLLLRFFIGEEIGIDHHSKQVHVKIDLNHFSPPGAVIEKIPINHGQLSFVIKTYNMSTLMASKIAAILLRGTRRVGKNAYEEKGRDIYDLLWYMEKKTTPNLDYLRARAKDMAIADLPELFGLLTQKMNQVNDKNLQHDLSPLFLDQNYIKNWLGQWRTSYSRLLESYEFYKIIRLHEIQIQQDFSTDNYLFKYVYEAEGSHVVNIIYTLSDYWLEDVEGKIPTEIDDKLVPLIRMFKEIKKSRITLLQRYTTLFNEKNAAYLKKSNNIVLGNTIQTKVICLTERELNKIHRNKAQLLTCTLEDLI